MASDRISPHSAPRHRAHSLILRLWPEMRGFEQEPPIWRGSLSELDGSRTRYFDNAAALWRLVVEVTEADQSGRPDGAA